MVDRAVFARGRQAVVPTMWSIRQPSPVRYCHFAGPRAANRSSRTRTATPPTFIMDLSDIFGGVHALLVQLFIMWPRLSRLRTRMENSVTRAAVRTPAALYKAAT